MCNSSSESRTWASLKEIKELLSLRVDPDTTCADVRRRANDKLSDIALKIRDLQRMKKTLTELADACPGRGATSACPIMEASMRRTLYQCPSRRNAGRRATPSARLSLTMRKAIGVVR